jgi:hypothetical protein
MPTYKAFLTRRNGAKVLDTIRSGEPPHVGNAISVGGVGAVVTSVNPTRFVDQERGPLDGVVYAAEGSAQELPPSAEVAVDALDPLEATESHPETRMPH